MSFHEATVDDLKFYIKKSDKKHKKYDVYDENKKYIGVSFGDKNYQHFYDQWGDYKHLNHLDPYRRQNYRKRAEGMGNLSNPYSANFWSYHTLW